MLFRDVRKVFMENFAFDLGLGKEMVMRSKRRPIRGNTVNKGRGRETRRSSVTSEWVVCLARAQSCEMK